MKKAVIVIIAILVVAGGVAAAVFLTDSDKDKEPSNTSSQASNSETNDDAAEESETAASTDQVEIADFAFGPETINIKKGTTVTWTNKDSAEHTVTPDEESGAFEGSELLAQGETYSFTFDEVGTYTYHCQPHPQMTGTVVVTE